MKVLVLAGPSPSTIFSHAPLGQALRNAGHQVIMASTIDELMPTIAGFGLAALPVANPNLTPAQVIAPDGVVPEIPKDPIERERLTGRWYARLEAVTMDALLTFTAGWRPDVIIGGMNAYAAPLLAIRLGVPHVRHAWDISDHRQMDIGAAVELRDTLAELGYDHIPDPDMMIDITPPSLRARDAMPAQMMRTIPCNTQSSLEPWMYTRGARTRICVTVGMGVTRHNEHAFLRDLVEKVGALDVEVVVPVPEDAAPALREQVPNVRAGWIPMDVLVPTCDLVVHQSGGSTMMTALSFGVPQLLLSDPHSRRATEMARSVVDYGAGIMLSPEEASFDAVAKSCHELIANPSYAAAAGVLAREIAALPLPSEVARRIEWLVHDSVGKLH